MQWQNTLTALSTDKLTEQYNILSAKYSCCFFFSHKNASFKQWVTGGRWAQTRLGDSTEMDRVGNKWIVYFTLSHSLISVYSECTPELANGLQTARALLSGTTRLIIDRCWCVHNYCAGAPLPKVDMVGISTDDSNSVYFRLNRSTWFELFFFFFI